MVSSAILSCFALIRRWWSVIRKPYSPQITVVPFTEPPVATRGLPFAIFFLRLMLGSSQLPKTGDVVEKLREHGTKAAVIGLICWRSGVAICRKGKALPILRPCKALANVDVLTDFITIGIIKHSCISRCWCRPSAKKSTPLEITTWLCQIIGCWAVFIWGGSFKQASARLRHQANVRVVLFRCQW